jgi:hypothetical protein
MNEKDTSREFYSVVQLNSDNPSLESLRVQRLEAPESDSMHPYPNL